MITDDCDMCGIEFNKDELIKIREDYWICESCFRYLDNLFIQFEKAKKKKEVENGKNE